MTQTRASAPTSIRAPAAGATSVSPAKPLTTSKGSPTASRPPQGSASSGAQTGCQCSSDKKVNARGNCCPGGTSNNDNDDFLTNLPTNTLHTSTTPGSPAKAEADGRALLAAGQVDRTFPPYTQHYQLTNNLVNGPVPHNIQAAFGGQAINLAGTARHLVINPIGHVGERPILGAYFLQNAIVITDVFADMDTNTGTNRLFPSEMIAQGAQNANSHPQVVAHHNVVNTATESFVDAALGTATTVTVNMNHGREHFLRLVGSDNGRVVQRMLNDHPTYFNGDDVTSVTVIKPAGAQYPHILYHL